MKIKSILIGSASILVAASAAQAADAIVVEPEPVEYVRVCDAYGSGYWYLPGTETCIKIGGYVRTTYAHRERDRNKNHQLFNIGSGYDDAELANLVAGPGNGSWTEGKADGLNESKWNYRGRLNFEVKNETEYGTLSSYLRVQGDGDGYGDGNVSIDRALISLAGFRAGYGDTYWTTNHDYGVSTPAINDGYYNYDQGVFADYTYAFEGFSITGGVQQSRYGSDFNGDSYYDKANNTVDWYAGIKWKTDWATIAFTALTDNNAVSTRYDAANAAYKIDTDADDTAYKVSAYVPFGDSSWRMGAWYAWEDDGNGRYIGSGNALAVAAQDKEWGAWIGGNLTDNFDIYGLYTEISGDSDNAIVSYKDVTGNSSDIDGDSFTQWTLGANWKPVSGLRVQFEYTNEERKADYGYGAQYDDSADIYQVRVVRSW